MKKFVLVCTLLFTCADGMMSTGSPYQVNPQVEKTSALLSQTQKTLAKIPADSPRQRDIVELID